MSTFATVDMKNKTITDVVVDKQTESYEQYLSRRGSTMAGMIGTLSGRLDILAMEMRLIMEYPLSDKNFFKTQLLDLRKSALETLIKYNHEWAEMQDYQEGHYMKESSDKKIADFTTELEALKTLAF